MSIFSLLVATRCGKSDGTGPAKVASIWGAAHVEELGRPVWIATAKALGVDLSPAPEIRCTCSADFHLVAGSVSGFDPNRALGVTIGDRVFVFVDNICRVSPGGAIDDTLRAVLAHEFTHVVQHRHYIRTPPAPAHSLPLQVLREAHAVLSAEQLAKELSFSGAQERAFRFTTDLELLFYVVGPRLLRRLVGSRPLHATAAELITRLRPPTLLELVCAGDNAVLRKAEQFRKASHNEWSVETTQNVWMLVGAERRLSAGVSATLPRVRAGLLSNDVEVVLLRTEQQPLRVDEIIERARSGTMALPSERGPVPRNVARWTRHGDHVVVMLDEQGGVAATPHAGWTLMVVFDELYDEQRSVALDLLEHLQTALEHTRSAEVGAARWTELFARGPLRSGTTNDIALVAARGSPSVYRALAERAHTLPAVARIAVAQRWPFEYGNDGCVLYSDPNESVRAAAFRALARATDAENPRALGMRALGDPSPRIRAIAVDILQRVGGDHSWTRRAFCDSSPVVRERAWSYRALSKGIDWKLAAAERDIRVLGAMLRSAEFQFAGQTSIPTALKAALLRALKTDELAIQLMAVKLAKCAVGDVEVGDALAAVAPPAQEEALRSLLRLDVQSSDVRAFALECIKRGVGTKDACTILGRAELSRSEHATLIETRDAVDPYEAIEATIALFRQPTKGATRHELVSWLPIAEMRQVREICTLLSTNDDARALQAELPSLDDWRRFEVAKALGRRIDRVPEVERALYCTSPLVRLDAAMYLDQLGDDPRVDDLFAIALSDPVSAIRTFVLATLRRDTSWTTPLVVDAILACLHDPDRSVQREAVRAVASGFSAVDVRRRVRHWARDSEDHRAIERFLDAVLDNRTLVLVPIVRELRDRADGGLSRRATAVLAALGE